MSLRGGGQQNGQAEKSELKPNLEVIRRDLGLPEDCPVIPFSAEKGDGREELVRRILSAVKE